jgi:hypothetical protein
MRTAQNPRRFILATKGIVEPEFASIEEWPGANTEDYYLLLAATGHGVWAPDGDAPLWVTFNLRAHHLPAQAVRRRWHNARQSYVLLDDVGTAHGLPERVVDLLYTALLGFWLRRATYVEQAGIDARTASHDFKALSALGLLRPVGETKGRYFVGDPALEPIRTQICRRAPLQDPYPRLPVKLAEAAGT